MVCCVCLLENPSNMDIFDDTGQELDIAGIINKYLWFKPEPDNSFSTQICTICWHKIYYFHTFYETVRRAHKEYEQSGLATIKIEISGNINPVKVEGDFCDEEVVNNNINDSMVSETKLEMKNPLEENSEMSFNDESDDNYGPVITSPQESSEEDDTIKSNKHRRKHLKIFEQDKNSTKKKRIIRRLDPVHTEEMIKKHIPMGCNICVFVGTTFSDIVQHFKDEHPKVRPYIMCCDKKLTRRFFVAQHALKHEDPNCFRCEECKKSFTSISGLRTHNLNYHPRNEDLIYSCDSCPKKFARTSLLELHKTSHIPKEQWQYYCDICPDKKKFASKYLLGVHTSMRHKREVNICPVCAKEIRDKKSYEKHVRLHYEDSGPRVRCPHANCESWLKDEDNLKQHLSRHNDEGKVFKCDECDKECSNRRALTNHKRYSHTSQIFQCDQCDKTFKKAISLREHLTQHTGETLYKCPFCTRTFNSNANMHAHKKKQHPVEWENWRKNKRESAQKLIKSNNSLNPIDESLMKLNYNSFNILK